MFETALSPKGLRGINVVAVSDIASENPGQLLAGTERVIYAGAELRLTQVDIDLPDGDRIWWDTVRLLRTASVALLDADGRVLLVRRSRLIQDRWGWELPGGVVDEDEDPCDTAARELSELAGYRPGQLTLVQAVQPAPHSVDGERLIYVGRDPERLEDSGPWPRPRSGSRPTRSENALKPAKSGIP